MEDVIYIRTTERKSWRTCRQQWWWGHIDRLHSVATRPALRFGDISHQSLAAWYVPGRKRGRKPWLTFEAVYNQQIEDGLRDFSIRLDEDEAWVNALELGLEMMHNYVAHWEDDDSMEIICPEFPFQVWMTDKRGRRLRVLGQDGKLYPVRYVGKFDALYRDHSQPHTQVGLLETKTAASINTAYLGLDEQAGSYWAMAPLVLPRYKWHGQPILRRGQDIDFIMYNFLRKAKPDTRPRSADGAYLNKPKRDVLAGEVRRLGLRASSNRVDDLMRCLSDAGVDPLLLGDVSKKQPAPFFHRQRVYRDTVDRQNLMQRIRMEAYEMGLVRAGKLPVYKNPSGNYPDQHCLACQFKDMCELHENGGDWEQLRDFTMVHWDPYADHDDRDWTYDEESQTSALSAAAVE